MNMESLRPAGGFEAAMRNGASDLDGLSKDIGFAVDLGPGFGMRAIPLACPHAMNQQPLA